MRGTKWNGMEPHIIRGPRKEQEAAWVKGQQPLAHVSREDPPGAGNVQTLLQTGPEEERARNISICLTYSALPSSLFHRRRRFLPYKAEEVSRGRATRSATALRFPLFTAPSQANKNSISVTSD
ncbi:hypothetical protein NL676_011677 [Syzygium grande]|nr:hypothetical protein NL676_011677 [Syzygium grande]